MKLTRTNWRAAFRAGAWGNHFRATPRRRPVPGWTLALLLAGVVIAAAQSTNVPGPADYDQFSTFITERNIFNPSRYSRTSRPVQPQPVERRFAPQFTLVGTMTYEKGMFAFFDGNQSDLRKVLYPSDTNGIAGYVLTGITFTNVTLESADRKQLVALNIGQGMQQEGGTWQKVAQGGYFGGGGGGSDSGYGGGGRNRGFGGRNRDYSGYGGGESATPAAEGSNPDSGASSGSALESNDVLKKLMQQRQQELK